MANVAGEALGKRGDAGQSGGAGGVDPLREVLAGEAVIMAANARTWPDAAWSSGQRSRIALRRGFSSAVRVSGRRQSQFVTSRTVGGAGGSGSCAGRFRAR